MERLRISGLLAATVLVILALGVNGVEGGFAAYNETLPEQPNLAAFRTLMLSSVSREDAVEECVGHIKAMRQKFAVPERYSFPSKNFVPKGAKKWCECLMANPPDIEGFEPLESYSDFYLYDRLSYYRSLVPQGLRDAYDASFNKCRAEVLRGSNINTVDICRGMFSLFGQNLNTLGVSFCGQLCRDPDSVPKFSQDLSSPEFGFNYDCADSCARKAMPGYCASTVLEYSNFYGHFGLGPGGSFVIRTASVDGERIISQNVWTPIPATKEKVDELCTAMAPRLGSKNECCNYEKGFYLTKRCCVLDGDGKAVFDCNSTTVDDFYHICTVEHNPIPEFLPRYYERYCNLLIDSHKDSPDAGKAKAYGNTVMFPEEMLQSICEGYGYPTGTTCCFATSIPFVANCVDKGRRQEYSGLIMGSRPKKPTPGAVEEKPDPCHGTCGEGSNCVLAGNGTPFCVECGALIRERPHGDVGCCMYDPVNMKCVTERRGWCKRDTALLFVDEEGERKEAVFRRSEGYACASPRDFMRNGHGCRVRVNSKTGKAMCD